MVAVLDSPHDSEWILREIAYQLLGRSEGLVDILKLVFNLWLATVLVHAAARMGAGRPSWSVKRFWLTVLASLPVEIVLLNLSYASFDPRILRSQLTILSIASGLLLFIALMPALLAWLLGRSIRSTPASTNANAE